MANLVASVTAAQGRKRKCPKCGHKQSVSSFLVTQPVPCHRCAAAIPPPDAAAKTRAAKEKSKGKSG